MRDIKIDYEHSFDLADHLLFHPIPSGSLLAFAQDTVLYSLHLPYI